jgi:hypothetical protein
VIPGSFKIGMGDRFADRNTLSLPAGSFAYLDPDIHHYAIASGEVAVQIHGMSPVQFNHINPSDDPRRKK